MSTFFPKLVAVVLAVLQVWVGCASGRVVCVRVATCGAHLESSSASTGCEHDRPGCDGHAPSVRVGVQHDLPSNDHGWAHHGCDCFWRVPMPHEPRLPGTDLGRVQVVATALRVEVAWYALVEARCETNQGMGRSDTPRIAERECALRVTRLRV